MENKELSNIWSAQAQELPVINSKLIIQKATMQRRNQKIGIAVMALTVAILVAYMLWQFTQELNNFMVGLFLMITSLVVRIAIELNASLNKINNLVKLSTSDFTSYLKRFYKWRKTTHYVITPSCFTMYVIGLTMLFPYFKEAFSSGFYTYLIVSAVGSLLVIAFIIYKQVRKELAFLTDLQKQ